jgi:hypothetical protein
MTSTCFAIPDVIYAWAVAKAKTNPEHAAAMSMAAARVFPIASLTRAAVDGIQ